MAENNTLKRAIFNTLFGHLSVYAQIRGIRFIHCNDSFQRTAERQNELFKQGKSRCDGYQAKSKHQLGRARDIYIIDEAGKIIWDKGPYETLGKFWETLRPGETKWGGNFKDFIDQFHYEL